MGPGQRVRSFVAEWGQTIDVGAKVIQATVIIVGVGLAVNEFYLKNSAAEYDKARLALDTVIPKGFTDKVNESRTAIRELKEEVYGYSSPDGDDKVRRIIEAKYYKAVADLGSFYKIVMGCLGADACSRRVVFGVLCDDAHNHWNLISELRSRAALGEPSSTAGDKILGIDTVSLPIGVFLDGCGEEYKKRPPK